MKVLSKITNFGSGLSSLQSIPLTLLRLVLAYGFFNPAKMKWSNITGVAEWFSSMNYPFPTINAYMATITETTGIIFLVLGFATRIISIPLIIIMLVAIATVHLNHGFEAGNNGFEIPLYYILMLLVLLFKGAGNFSIDSLLAKRM